MIDFESYYLFGGKTYKDLRIGSAMIEEVLAREVKKAEEEAMSKAKEAQSAAGKSSGMSGRDLVRVLNPSAPCI